MVNAGEVAERVTFPHHAKARKQKLLHGLKVGFKFVSMSNDHFVPKAYLRGFTLEYLANKKGGELVVYVAASGKSRKVSINAHIACEPEFYNNHLLDKEWSKTIERTWPDVRNGLRDCENAPQLLEQLFWFVGAQYVRTHTFMNEVSRSLMMHKAKRTPISFSFESRQVTGLFLDMASTTEVMDSVRSFYPRICKLLLSDYVWTLYHNSGSQWFLTNDDPCRSNPKTKSITMPLALDLALVGRVLNSGEGPSFHHCNASTDLIGEINRSIVSGCNSWVYAHEETEDLRCFIRENFVKRDILLSGRAFTNDQQPLGDEEIRKLLKTVEELRKKKVGDETGKA
jgi:Protein of unknown function (DUF4238)